MRRRVDNTWVHKSRITRAPPSRLRLLCLFVSGQHGRFHGFRNPKSNSTKLFHDFWKIEVSEQGCLQQNRQRTRYFDVPGLRLSKAKSLINQENVSLDLNGKADCLAFSSSQIHRKGCVHLPNLHRFKPRGWCRCPSAHLRGRFRMLQLNQNSLRNQNAAIDRVKKIGMI